jgi:hypothetical protein
MKKIIDLILEPDIAFDDIKLKEAVCKKSGIPLDEQVLIQKLKRSIDARSRSIKVNYQVALYHQEPIQENVLFKKQYQNVSQAHHRVVVVGSGPAGIFAALRLIELGVKPILIERGKDVRARRRDLADINKKHLVNPESNYCFGEGGAGTYSDGKLYTRSKKRGDVRRILEILNAHGASEEILIDNHPHIGTNKLPAVVANLRQSILDAGGEVHFNTKLIDFDIQFGAVKAIKTENGQSIPADAVILATGHSARDIFQLCLEKGIKIEAKPFALGVRVEHGQQLIDKIQYHSTPRNPILPAASYALVDQTQYEQVERGVFSFCMCPGGFVVPAATAAEEVVVNGMSPSRRDSKYANSGIVVAIETSDLKSYEKYKELMCLQFQKEIEHKAWLAGGKTQVAPAQRLLDFVQKKISPSLNETSYQPGLNSVEMESVLPAALISRLRQGFQAFGKKMNGYLTNDAQIIGVESRTSSPVLIPRDREHLEHVSISRLYPCGEGAGYAGGIVSAAMDGERCAEQLVLKYCKELKQINHNL